MTRRNQESMRKPVSTESTVHDFVLAPLEISYETDLETDDGDLQGWGTPEPGWQWGAPSGPSPSAHSGTNLWGTRLATEYVGEFKQQIEIFL